MDEWIRRYVANNERRYLNIRSECNRIIRSAKRKHKTKFAVESISNPINFWKYAIKY